MSELGSLRTYLGTAPGVGKTYAMLAEGRRRAASGERVAVGWVERHGRGRTRAQLGDLEVVAPRRVSYHGSTFADLDVSAVIARDPDLVLVDELAHWVPDKRRPRWKDVAELRHAGLDVVTTTNVANLVSIRDVAARITGVGSVESVPDDFVRAGEVTLIDLPAEVLRRRIASGHVYSADLVGGALGNYFQASNLQALSRLGRAWMDGAVAAVGDELLAGRGLGPPVGRPLVLAGVSASARGEQVIRRAAQLARDTDAELDVVHVDVTDGSPRDRSGELERYRALTAAAGGTYTEIQGTAPADALAAAARTRGASRVVVGPRRTRLGGLLRRPVAWRLRRLLGDVPIDEVHEAG